MLTIFRWKLRVEGLQGDANSLASSKSSKHQAWGLCPHLQCYHEAVTDTRKGIVATEVGKFVGGDERAMEQRKRGVPASL